MRRMFVIREGQSDVAGFHQAGSAAATLGTRQVAS